MMVVVYFTPGGDSLMKSYHEFKTKEECIAASDKAKGFPHPYGLTVDISCKQMVIKLP